LDDIMDTLSNSRFNMQGGSLYGIFVHHVRRRGIYLGAIYLYDKN